MGFVLILEMYAQDLHVKEFALAIALLIVLVIALLFVLTNVMVLISNKPA
jgi:hypothetical protein